MDDLSSIISIVVVFGLFLLNTLQKRAAEAKKRSERAAADGDAQQEAPRTPWAEEQPAGQGLPEAWPPILRELRRRAAADGPRAGDSSGAGSGSGEVPASSAAPRGHATQSPEQKGRKQAAVPFGGSAASAAARAHAPKTMAGETSAAAEAAGQRVDEEFDVRRAVIYSEILKPKFSEYE